MTKQVTLHYLRAVWRICYYRWFSKCVTQPRWFCFITRPSFFFFSFLVKMCLILIFVEFAMQWYVTSLLKWNESDGKKQLFSIYKYLKQQNDQINVRLRSFELPSLIFSKQVFEEWAPLVKVYLLSLSCWKTETEQRRFSGDDLDSHSWREAVTASDVIIYTQTQTSGINEQNICRCVPPIQLLCLF